MSLNYNLSFAHCFSGGSVLPIWNVKSGGNSRSAVVQGWSQNEWPCFWGTPGNQSFNSALERSNSQKRDLWTVSPQRKDEIWSNGYTHHCTTHVGVKAHPTSQLYMVSKLKSQQKKTNIRRSTTKLFPFIVKCEESHKLNLKLQKKANFGSLM